jgi:hypothetical protein
MESGGLREWALKSRKYFKKNLLQSGKVHHGALGWRHSWVSHGRRAITIERLVFFETFG